MVRRRRGPVRARGVVLGREGHAGILRRQVTRREVRRVRRVRRRRAVRLWRAVRQGRAVRVWRAAERWRAVRQVRQGWTAVRHGRAVRVWRWRAVRRGRPVLRDAVPWHLLKHWHRH